MELPKFKVGDKYVEELVGSTCYGTILGITKSASGYSYSVSGHFGHPSEDKLRKPSIVESKICFQN